MTGSALTLATGTEFQTKPARRWIDERAWEYLPKGSHVGRPALCALDRPGHGIPVRAP